MEHTEETGDLRGNPPASGIVRHDSHIDPTGKRTRLALVGGKYNSHYTNAAPRSCSLSNQEVKRNEVHMLTQLTLHIQKVLTLMDVLGFECGAFRPRSSLGSNGPACLHRFSPFLAEKRGLGKSYIGTRYKCANAPTRSALNWHAVFS
ncbi:hypothetical protein PR048_010244 [Dryococelus australis]|uniref:Uncharacterized protein n=1 Tax=Dryococelus australis TaxID=614101 RepID=A0ABQ9I257_9NEOP|nr:hypothetical protein PR048_010244 [Dryococelus australis]